MLKTPETREQEWIEFSEIVLKHVKEYTTGQYGNKGSDFCTKKDFQFCLDQIEKYMKRRGKNSREGQELLDIVKIAHYGCIAYWKFIEENEDTNKILNPENEDTNTLLRKLVLQNKIIISLLDK